MRKLGITFVLAAAAVSWLVLDFFTGNDLAWKEEQGIVVSPDGDNSLEVRSMGRIVIVVIATGMLLFVVNCSMPNERRGL